MPLEVTPNSSPSRLLKKFFISFLTFGEAGKSRVFLQICWQDRWMTDDSCQQSMWYFWWSSDITKKCRKSMEIPTCHGWKIPESSVFTFFWLGIFYWSCKFGIPSIHLSSLGLGISKVNRKMTWMTFRNQTTIPSQKREDTHLIHTKSLLDSADAMFPSLFIFWCPPPKKKTYNNPPWKWWWHLPRSRWWRRGRGRNVFQRRGLFTSFGAALALPALLFSQLDLREAFFLFFFRAEESSLFCWCCCVFFWQFFFFLGEILGDFFWMTDML